MKILFQFAIRAWRDLYHNQGKINEMMIIPRPSKSRDDFKTIVRCFKMAQNYQLQLQTNSLTKLQHDKFSIKSAEGMFQTRFQFLFVVTFRFYLGNGGDITQQAQRERTENVLIPRTAGCMYAVSSERENTFKIMHCSSVMWCALQVRSNFTIFARCNRLWKMCLCSIYDYAHVTRRYCGK